jgi:hypothetical protein
MAMLRARAAPAVTAERSRPALQLEMETIGLMAIVGLEVAPTGYDRLHFLDLAPKLLKLDLAEAEVRSQRFWND